MTTRPTQSTPEPRAIRLFVSSTFSDMHAEREELIKRVFPELRKICAKRFVVWGEVDLRWGISDEQKAEGRVLPICLEEIRRCRPYFIALLGERYGWIPKEIPEDLKESHPWLKEHPQKSVTELEILHGVLRNPEMADRAFFYLRDPRYVDSIPKKGRHEFLNEPTEQEIKEYGQAEARRRAEEKEGKLRDLKLRICESKLPLRDNYKDPQELGRLVLEDMLGVINKLFPEDQLPDPLDREAIEHQAFANSRTRVYVMNPGRKEGYFRQLDGHADGDGPPLVVLGESGVGKSALLANWAGHYLESHKNAHLLMHFIGASPYSANWAGMLRRIMGELKRRFGIQQDIPDKPDQLRQAFANFLSMASTSAEKNKEKIILILDALNQLEDQDQAPDLVWLPPVIPSNVRMIVSTLPGRPLEELKRRGWPRMEVATLDESERTEFIRFYLKELYSKGLEPKDSIRIAKADQTVNPLYLQVLLEELRMYGKRDVTSRIDHYLETKTLQELYEKVLERYEQDYERERKGLVCEAMSLLWAARRGLTEAELLELLGERGEKLPQLHWSYLYNAAEHSLVNRSGLIGFFHDYLRQAVRARYLSTERQQNEAHLRLAGYFDKRRLEARAIDELPWQLAEAREWKGLYNLLSDLPSFSACWANDKFETMSYWASVEANSPLSMIEAYKPVLERPDQHATYANIIALLLYETGKRAEALSLAECLIRYFRQTGDRVSLLAQLNQKALILRQHGELEKAIVLHKEVEHTCWELGDKLGLAASLGNQALILRDKGDLDKAMELHKKEEQIHQELGDKRGLAISLGNQGIILMYKGDLDRAIELQKEDEQLCRELGNKLEMARCLGNQALILMYKGDLDKAMEIHKEEERMCQELGDKEGLARSFHNQAIILHQKGELDRALGLLKKGERIFRELGNKLETSHSLGGQARILTDKGDLEKAMELLKENEQICRGLQYKLGLAHSLANQAGIQAMKGRPKEALSLAEEAYQIATKYGLNALAGQIRPILDKIRTL